MQGEAYFRELLSGERNSPGDRALLALLRGAALPYGAAMTLRALAYQIGRAHV